MLSAADNDILTHLSPQTLMGRYFRRFWQPVALSRELPEPDGAPLRVNVLGERLVAFRNSDGTVGLVDARCPHRGADLYFGRNENRAIRCVSMAGSSTCRAGPWSCPTCPAGASCHRSLRLKAYPTREYGEIVWAYMGPDPWGRELPEVPAARIRRAARVPSLRDEEAAGVQLGPVDRGRARYLALLFPAHARAQRAFERQSGRARGRSGCAGSATIRCRSSRFSSMRSASSWAARGAPMTACATGAARSSRFRRTARRQIHAAGRNAFRLFLGAGR